MAQEAIEAAEESDFSVIEKLIEVITNPFDELDEYQLCRKVSGMGKRFRNILLFLSHKKILYLIFYPI